MVCAGTGVWRWTLNSIDWAQLSRFYLQMETEGSLQNVVLKNKQDSCLDKSKMIVSKNIIFVLM
jgi:hypothetical protein